MPKVSIIIPCYNQGHWLNEAVDSAMAQDFEDFDVILINDGSTDPVSNRIFDSIDHPQVTKIITKNQGLAEARNTAIRSTEATFILPLDSDDRLEPDFLKKTVPILETNQQVGIVYTKVGLYGEQQGVSSVEPYSFPEVLINPQIVATALYRRLDWESVGGYKSDMIYGWEDYDFWLSIIKQGLEVRLVPEVLFHYRQTTGSMAGMDRKKMLYSFNRLYEHHKSLYEANIGVLFDAVIETKPMRDRMAGKETFEIYIPNNEGYTARNIKEQHYVHNIWSRINFQILEPIQGNVDRLRLDPGSRIGIYDIAFIKITSAIDGSLLWEANSATGFSHIALSGSTQRIEHECLLRILNIGSDPYFYLPDFSKTTAEQPIEVELWVRHHADLSELSTESKFVSEPNEQLVKIRDLQEALQFQKEQEQLLRYQEISLREELQNLRNERSMMQSEVNNQHATTKAIQAEMFSLQSEYKQLVQENNNLKLSMKEKVSTPEPSKKKKWF